MSINKYEIRQAKSWVGSSGTGESIKAVLYTYNWQQGCRTGSW